MNHTRSSRAEMIQRTERAPSSVSPAACAVVVVVVVADMKIQAAEGTSRPSRVALDTERRGAHNPENSDRRGGAILSQRAGRPRAAGRRAEGFSRDGRQRQGTARAALA